MSKRILLTGATGYLGRRLFDRLVSLQYEVIVLLRAGHRQSSNDALRSQAREVVILPQPWGKDYLESVLRLHKIELILHTAADYGQTSLDKVELLDANLRLPLALLDAAVPAKVSCFINTDTALKRETNAYSLSKKQFLEWMGSYASHLSCINVCLESFYGPGEDPHRFISSILHAFQQRTSEIKLTLGEQRRDFVFIDDVVDSFIAIIKSSKASETGYHEFEVGSGEAVQIRQLVMQMRDMFGATKTQLNFGAVPYRAHELMGSDTDLAEIKKLNWSPKVSLEDGLQKMISFIKESSK